MTGKQKILWILKDKKWHSFRELLDVYYKYTQRIYDLRSEGYVIEERPNSKNKHAMDYRLALEPGEGRAFGATQGSLFNQDQHGFFVPRDV